MNHTPTINTVILGASGYTGAELIRLLAEHPQVRIQALTADSSAGKSMWEVYPHLAYLGLPPLSSLEQVDFASIDLVFCCLPHGTTQNVIAGLPEHVRIVDLSADFRLFDTGSYAQWYGHAHQAPELQKTAVYGLTEIYRQVIAKARLVANPGCYPTSILLPLLPLLKAKQIVPEGIVIDAKSGISGAGRGVKQANLYAEIAEGVSAYSLGGHRHAPEMEQELALAAAQPVTVTFSPHLMPMTRGMLSTIYVTLSAQTSAATLRETLANAYRHEPFVTVLPQKAYPATQQVRGTNQCRIAVFEDRVKERAVIVSVIDNLVKGASGQAVQNMNAMFGLPETLGLPKVAVFP